MNNSRYFFEEIVEPNASVFAGRDQDERKAVNAILAIDALLKQIFRHLKEIDHPPVSAIATDDLYRDMIAERNRDYRILRDMAAALKHGESDPSRKKARLVQKSEHLEYRDVRPADLGPWDDPAGSAVFIETTREAVPAVEVVRDVVRYADDLLEEHDL